MNDKIDDALLAIDAYVHLLDTHEKEDVQGEHESLGTLVDSDGVD